MNNFFKYNATSTRPELFIYVPKYIGKLRDIKHVVVFYIACICVFMYIFV